MESTFQSGSFPAQAVGAVFGEVSPNTGPTKEFEQLQRAVNVAAEKYAALFQDEDATLEMLTKASERHKQAVEKLREHQRSAAGGDALDEKFVFVYSTDPGKIIEAINKVLERQQLSQLLAGLTQSRIIEDAAKAKRGVDRVRARTAHRQNLIDSSETTIGRAVDVQPTDAASANASAAVVKAVAGTLRTVAESLR